MDWALILKIILIMFKIQKTAGSSRVLKGDGSIRKT